MSLVRKGVGYDEVYPSGHGPKEGLSWSLEREPSAHSPDDEEESYDGEEEGKEGEDKENEEGCEGEDDEDKGESNGSFYGRKFRKPKGWSYLSFYPSCDMNRQ